MTATKHTASKPKKSAKPRGHKPARRWSQDVTEHSDALDLERNVFTLNDPKEIAASLKRSAEQSHRRKSDPYRSAMSMLTFYINRAGTNLTRERKRVLERAKDELRKSFGMSP
jgi:phosphoenolpyruvate carboxylase